jgi:4-hydroxy-3-polyprenylbenzoate decarboxylase
MSYYRDLREYLTALEASGKLRRVKRQVNKDTELHPLVAWQFRGLEEADRTGFLFENVTDIKDKKYRGGVATCVIAPSRQVFALGMKCEPGQLNEKWKEAYQHPRPPHLVSDGPVKEEVHVGGGLLEHGGLTEFPIPMTANGWESLPRLSALSWHTKDPDTSITNVGTYNGYLLGTDRSSCRTIHSHILIHWNKCRQRGIPLQAAAVVGAVPAVVMTSVNKVPYGINELDIAGGIAGEPIEVVKCETVDLEVPATAEVVIEGEIPTDYREPDPASAEHTGYTLLGSKVFAFKVKCITHRKNPLWHDMVIHTPPCEDSTIRMISNCGRLSSFLRDSCGIPEVKDVAFHQCGAANRICVIQMQDLGGVRTHNSVVWQTLFGTLAAWPRMPKLVIAVDEDIDPWDLESVLWAVSFRCQPHRDTKIIQGRRANLDQSAGYYGLDQEEAYYPTSRSAPLGASAMLMDATRKWDYTPVSLPKRSYMEHARELWQELGFTPLKPRQPWYGVSLGAWPESYQRQAELAEKGEFDQVAQELMSQGERMPGP